MFQLTHRALSISMCCAIAYSGSVAGVNSGIEAIGSFVKRHFQQAEMYTDQPHPAYLGPHPGRNSGRRGGLWSERAIQDNKFSEPEASIDPDLSAFFALSASPDAGPGLPWEGSIGAVDSGSVNTANGNKLTVIPLTHWKCKGGMTLDCTLYHSSEAANNQELGQHWTWTYKIFLQVKGNTGVLHWGNGLAVPYSKSGSTFTAPAGIYETLVTNGDNTYTVTTKDQVKYHLTTAGYCDSITDRNGNAITISLNGSNQPTAVTDPTGRILTIQYSGGKVSEFDAPDGNHWNLSYSSDDLSTVTWPYISSTITDVFSYNAGHCITTHTDRRGKSWTATYNTDKSIATEVNPLSKTWSYSYTSSATTITDPLSHTIVDNYSSGIWASRVDKSSYTESFTSRDSNNEVLTFVDKRGKSWTHTYDSKGNSLTTTDPNSHTWTTTYNSINEPLTLTDPLSHVRTWTYDTSGNMLTFVDGLSRTQITNTYNGAGQLLTSTDALSNETDFTYDTDGNVASVTDPLSHTKSYFYNDLGRITTVEDALTHNTNIDYDAWQRPIDVINDDTTSKAITYNATGRVTQVSDELSHHNDFAYDDAGRLTSWTNPVSDVESYGHDDANRRTTVTNGRSYTRTYAFTNRGEVYTLTMPDSTVELWSHNGNGDVTKYENQLVDDISYSYDDAGRQTGIDYPTGTDPSFGYDNADRLTSMVDSIGTTSWGYDNADEVTSLNTPQGNMTYTYYDDGSRHTMVEGVGTTTYSYDDAQRLTSLVNPYSETTTWDYDAADRCTKQTFNTGFYTSSGYDTRDRLTSLVHKNSSNSTISSESYVYDDASNLYTKTVDGTTTTYGYDYADQLTSESRSGYSASYTYDANGNRLAKTLNSSTDDYHYNDVDELTYISHNGSTTKTYSYDDAGRTTGVTVSGNTTTLDYDFDGRLTTITYPSTATNTFTYNALDARVSKVDSAGTFTYKRGGAESDDATLSDGSAAYTPGISERRSGATKFYHLNDLGTISRLTNTSQSTSDTRQYDAFGLQVSATGSTPTPFGFAGAWGYEEDADSGLKLLGHRYYDPTTGRFLTRDLSKDGRNWYSYCNSNPLKFIDPQGLQSMDSLDATLQRAASQGADALEDLIGTWEESGGIPQKFLDKARFLLNRLRTKASDWIAKNLKGSINREFPSQLREKTLDEIRQEARGGSSVAKKAWKLLNDSRFRK